VTARKTAGHSPKHVSSRKHEPTSKHSPSSPGKSPASHKTAKVTAVARHATHAKARGFAVGDLLPACAFEALAMSLRLAGQLVDDDEVAGLWSLAGADPLGASLAAALDAARLHGLAGFRPQAHRLVGVPEVGGFAQDLLALPPGDEEAAALGHLDELLAGDLHGLLRLDLYAGLVEQPGELAAVGHLAVDEFLNAHVRDHVADDLAPRGVAVQVAEYAHGVNAAQLQPLIDLAGRTLEVHGLILGVDVPGPHCVLATADGWWSWGELHSPWPARIEEAWAVSWS
jgi:hypothetical protein